MFGLFSDGGLIPEDSARLRRVERKLDIGMKRLGVAFFEAGDLPESGRAAADRGEKIAAVKVYREATGAGLAELLRAVEEYLAPTKSKPS